MTNVSNALPSGKMILSKGVYVDPPTPKQIEAWLEANGYEKDTDEPISESGYDWYRGMSRIWVVHTGSDMWLIQKAWEAIDDITFSTVNPAKSRRQVYDEIMTYPKE